MAKIRQRIAIGSDHGGFEMKTSLIRAIRGWGHEVKDCGCYSSESYDFPVSASDVAKAVASKSCDAGVIVDGAGSPSAIVANKFAGIRASVVHNEFTAKISREHSDANIISFGAKVIDAAEAARLLEIWLRTDFLGGKYQKRIDMIHEAERKNANGSSKSKFVTSRSLEDDPSPTILDSSRVTPLAREILAEKKSGATGK